MQFTCIEKAYKAYISSQLLKWTSLYSYTANEAAQSALDVISEMGRLDKTPAHWFSLAIARIISSHCGRVEAINYLEEAEPFLRKHDLKQLVNTSLPLRVVIGFMDQNIVKPSSVLSEDKNAWVIDFPDFHDASSGDELHILMCLNNLLDYSVKCWEKLRAPQRLLFNCGESKGVCKDFVKQHTEAFLSKKYAEKGWASPPEILFSLAA